MRVFHPILGNLVKRGWGSWGGWGDGGDGGDGGDVQHLDLRCYPLLFVVTTSVVAALLGISQVTPRYQA
jgi:hypothetical protein